jgi:hypothetical protein
MERETIRKIRDAVGQDGYPENSPPTLLNAALDIDWAGTFLPKHRTGNPGITQNVLSKFAGVFIDLSSRGGAHMSHVSHRIFLSLTIAALATCMAPPAMGK